MNHDWAMKPIIWSFLVRYLYIHKSSFVFKVVEKMQKKALVFFRTNSVELLTGL